MKARIIVGLLLLMLTMAMLSRNVPQPQAQEIIWVDSRQLDQPAANPPDEDKDDTFYAYAE